MITRRKFLGIVIKAALISSVVAIAPKTAISKLVQSPSTIKRHEMPRDFIHHCYLSNNVKDWGAKGDGITDDSFAIQRCIDYWSTAYFPEGTYNLSLQKPLPSSTQLIGEDVKKVTIKFKS